MTIKCAFAIRHLPTTENFIGKKAGNDFANSKQKHNVAPQNGGNAYINAAR